MKRLSSLQVRLGVRSILTIAGALAFVVVAHAQFSDITAPEVLDFDFTPTSVDVSSGPQNVVLTFHVTDDLSGATGAWANFQSPSGSQFLQGFAPRISGDGMDGMYQGTLEVPQFVEAGTWTVVSVNASDAVGNFTNLSTAILAGRGFPTALEVLSSDPDTTPPVLTSVEFDPTSIDVSSSDQMVEVLLSVSDAETGVGFNRCCSSSVVIASPSQQQIHYLWSVNFTLVSGNNNTGVWSAQFRIPTLSEAGDWQVLNVGLADAVGNSSFYFGPTLAAVSGPPLAVTSTPEDTTPPTLTNFSFSPTVINTSASNQFVTVRFEATDDLAGVEFSPTTPFVSFFESGVQFRSPSGQQVRGICCAQSAPVSGTPLNGIWEAQVFFPQFSEDGTWKANFLNIKDRVRNQVSLNDADLETAGLPTQLVILRPSLENDGTVDSGGGTVSDDTFGADAQVTFPAGAVGGSTDVAIDVFLDPLDIPAPTGFIAAGTKFVNIDITPEPAFPLPPPGLTVKLPLEDPLPSGSPLTLHKVDETTGDLVPAVSVFGGPVIGSVDGPGPDGTTATFTGIASLSTIVGLIPDAITVSIDIRPGSLTNPINIRSQGVVPVAILGSSTFDVKSLAPETLTFGPGAAGPTHDLTSARTLADHIIDVNVDGYPDLVFHPKQTDSGIRQGDTEACVGGETQAGTSITGCDSIQVVR